MKATFYFLASISILLLAGCASSPLSLKNEGLIHNEYPLKVSTKTGEKVEFVSADWMINNWKYDSVRKAWHRKMGSPFEGKVSIDLDDDGVVEVVKDYYLDLELTNTRNNAKIYVDLMPIPRSKKNLEMDFFLDNFVETNSSNVAWLETTRFSHNEVAEKSYATKIVEQKTFSGNGYDGIVSIVERADLNQLKLDPKHRSDTIAILFLRLDDAHKQIVRNGKVERYPSVLTVFVVAKPKYFDGVKSDFYSLTKAIRLKGKQLNIPDLGFVNNKLHAAN